MFLIRGIGYSVKEKDDRYVVSIYLHGRQALPSSAQYDGKSPHAAIPFVSEILEAVE